MSDLGWSVRPYKSGDEVALVALWRLVFGRPMTTEAWLWKLKGRTSPVENVWVAENADRRIIGQYAAIPASLKLGSRDVRAMVVVDLMTHPDFRRRGVLAALGDKAAEAWSAAGFELLLGLPNENAQTSHSAWQLDFRLRWSRLILRYDEVISRPGVLPRPARPVASGAAALIDRVRARSLKAHRHEEIAVEQVGRGGVFPRESFDSLWRGVASTHENVQRRDGDWWRWRFEQCATVPYRLLLASEVGVPVGAAAYRINDDGSGRRAVLCELLAASGDSRAVEAVLSAVVRELWQERVGTVVALTPAGGHMESQLRVFGFTPQPGEFDVMHVPLQRGAQSLIPVDPTSWHMSGSDFDVV